MDAKKTVAAQCQEIRNMWRELWLAMSNGDITRYNAIKAIQVIEFWKIYDQWKARIHAEREHFKHQNAHRNGRRK